MVVDRSDAHSHLIGEHCATEAAAEANQQLLVLCSQLGREGREFVQKPAVVGIEWSSRHASLLGRGAGQLCVACPRWRKPVRVGKLD